MPLTPTGAAGEYVAGVRHGAWQPPSALHPSIGVDTPLRFDVVRSVPTRAAGGADQ